MRKEKEMGKKFKLGRVVVTAEIDKLMETDCGFRNFVETSLGRFINCDWGTMSDKDKPGNDKAVRDGGERIHGSYIRKEDEREIWIITESDRSVTTILFPDEY